MKPEKREFITLEVPKEMKRQLSIRSKKEGMKVSALVRLVLRKYLGVGQ